MRNKIILIILVLFVFLNFNQLNGGKKKVTVYRENYLTSATEAGFDSEALYRCVLDTLGSDRISATDDELSAITEVICRSSSITSTKGIEKLTSLRYLNLYDNKVSSIDLSKNTALVMLNMTFNNLSSIDLSKNTNLQQLYLNGNRISTIDLSNNSRLIDLNIYNNNLSSINISNLTELKFLLLSLNKLTSLDLSHNTKLEHVYLSGNNISELVLPTNAPNLTRLDLNANKLTSIDLSKLTALEYLILSANKLSSLDVTKNTELQQLYVSSNMISSIDLSKNTNLIDLDLFNNKLTSVDVSNLSDLRYINVSVNNLSSLNLSNLSNLNKIYASSNNLSELKLNNQNDITELNAVFNDFNGYAVNDKSKVKYLVVDNDWMNNFDLSPYTGLEKLDIDSYEIIPVYGTSISTSDLIKRVPSNLSLNKYAVYKGFSGINRSICEYDVVYTVDGSQSSTETTTVNTCEDDSYRASTISGEYGSYSRFQVFSDSLTINGVTTNASLQFDGYYELRFMKLISNKYVIDDDKATIDVGSDSDEEIRNNLSTSWTGSIYEINGNKLVVKYNNQVVKEFTLQRVSNPKTGSLIIYGVIFMLIASFVVTFIVHMKSISIKNDEV